MITIYHDVNSDDIPHEFRIRSGSDIELALSYLKDFNPEDLLAISDGAEVRARGEVRVVVPVLRLKMLAETDRDYLEGYIPGVEAKALFMADLWDCLNLSMPISDVVDKLIIAGA